MARKRGLNRDDVVRAAVTIADREGVEAVTLARVAAELDVRSPSLYSYVDGLAGLRREVALAAVQGLEAALGDAIGDHHGADALRAVAVAYRAFALEHPGIYAMIQTTPTEAVDEAGYAAFASVAVAVATIVEELGARPEDAVALVRSVRSALHGFVSLEASGGFGMPDDIDESFAVLVDLLVAGVDGMSRSD